jgi:hypothetical protein
MEASNNEMGILPWRLPVALQAMRPREEAVSD